MKVSGASYTMLVISLWTSLLGHPWYGLVRDYSSALMDRQYGCTFRIPNQEVTAEWHRWLKAHLRETVDSSTLAGMHKILMDGNALEFQATFTAFVQEHLSLFCVSQHKEKVYQALCFALFFALSDTSDRYEIKMEQGHGHGRTAITVHPQTPSCVLSLVFEIKRVATHSSSGGKKRKLKSTDRLKKELSRATDDALQQIEQRQYRAQAPADARKIHEYGLAFAGKICVAVVRTLQREVDDGDWVEVDRGTAVVPDHLSKTDLLADGDDTDVDE